jgi:hypothetical protein
MDVALLRSGYYVLHVFLKDGIEVMNFVKN